MRIRQQGFISFGSMSLIIGGLALFGLLFYGMVSGHELPLWPALLVVVLNLYGAYRLVVEKWQRPPEPFGAVVTGAKQPASKQRKTR